MNIVSPLQMADLVSPQQRIVDSFHHRRNAVGWIQTLVGIHLARQIGIRCHLPSAKLDGFQARLNLLDRLVPSECSKRRHIIFFLEQFPEAFGAQRQAKVYSIFTVPRSLSKIGRAHV